MKARAARVAGLAVVVVGLVCCASFASAELTARGDLFVKFNGGITPNALPRAARAPISVGVSGVVRTLSGERPPALRRIAIAINRGGHIDTNGLPRCRQSQIEPASTRAAMAACGPALVGTGSYVADLAFPEQPAFATRGRIVAFNAIVGGQRAILVHVYGTQPIPITRIIVFRLRENGGTYGNVLVGTLPADQIRYGYLKRISLNLHRTFEYRGRRHSYLSAACEAPPGFPGAVFSFARVSMSFADGRQLSSTLTRSCTVRGGAAGRVAR